jgi:DegV family protein with EDD domain
MSPSPIAIITDSTCDLPQDLIDRYSIKVVPHYIIWGNQEYRDRVTLQPEEFYRRLESDPVRPSSSQAGIPDFLQSYEEAILRGVKEIVVVTVSSAMSGAHQMALAAAEKVNIPVHVVDSKGPTMSLGWQVLVGARIQAAGGDVKAILEKMDRVRQKLTLIVCMNTLEYLQKGGRIGGAAKWIGTRLHIKPVVAINHASGLVEPVGVTRTHKNAIEMMYDKFFEGVGKDGALHVAVLHGNVLEEARELAERIRQNSAPAELLINITGPVLGINTGPRALALCGYRE